MDNRHLMRLAMHWTAILGVADVLHAQSPTANPADVATIAAIVRVSYEVISGPAGTPRQWRRDSTLYSPTATFVAMSERDGRAVVTTMTAEDYRRINNERFVANGLFETEVGSRIERFGNVAQVRSVSVSRRTPNGPIDGRYVNYFALYWDGTRWWISGIVWDEERPNNPIPKSWIGVRDEVNVPAVAVAAQSRADSIEILKQLAPEVWKAVKGQPPNGPERLIAGDDLTRAALDSFLISQRTPFLTEQVKGEGTRCAHALPEARGARAYVVTLKVHELKGNTAKAGFVLQCGHGEAPGTAFATGSHFILRRVDGHWVLGELIGVFIS